MDISKLQSLGILTKEEELKTIEYKIKPNTLVLEALEPFPGYHGENLPSDDKPEAIYLITAKKYSTELIFRLSKKIKNFVSFDYDAIPAEIIINNESFFCIRIRFINNYDVIEELQSWFSDEGILFQKKKNIQATALINLRKIFRIEKVSEDIYKDNDDSNIYYFEIPREVSWSLFRKITFSVKNNIDNRNYDAAKGFIFYERITDVVRIYCKNITIERLNDIRNRYLSEIKKYS